MADCGTHLVQSVVLTVRMAVWVMRFEARGPFVDGVAGCTLIVRNSARRPEVMLIGLSATTVLPQKCDPGSVSGRQRREAHWAPTTVRRPRPSQLTAAQVTRA